MNFSLSFSEERIEEVSESLAKETATTPATLKRKFQAIHYARGTGLSSSAIIQRGQSLVLSTYAHAQQNGRAEKQRMLRWRVSAGLADAIRSHEASDAQEESLEARLVRVIKIRTSEELWEFMHSVFADLSDKDLLHLAGEQEIKRKRK